MGHNLSGDVLVKAAGSGATGTGAIWTPVAVDLSGGYDRAMIIVSRGGLTATNIEGMITASVWESASSAGTYTIISGSLGTSGSLLGTAPSNDNTALLIDVPVNGAKPFLKVYGTAAYTAGTAEPQVAALVLGYRGTKLSPPTQDNTAILV